MSDSNSIDSIEATDRFNGALSLALIGTNFFFQMKPTWKFFLDHSPLSSIGLIAYLVLDINAIWLGYSHLKKNPSHTAYDTAKVVARGIRACFDAAAVSLALAAKVTAISMAPLLVSVLFFFPMVTTMFCYSIALWQVSVKLKQLADEQQPEYRNLIQAYSYSKNEIIATGVFALLFATTLFLPVILAIPFFYFALFNVVLFFGCSAHYCYLGFKKKQPMSQPGPGKPWCSLLRENLPQWPELKNPFTSFTVKAKQ